MAYIYQIEHIAQDIFENIDEDSSLSPGAISFWIRGKIGDLNNLLFGSWVLNDAGNEISPLLNNEEVAIVKSMFMVYYYNRMIRNNVGASAFDSVVELSTDGGVIRKQNRNELAKTYLQMARDEQENLKSLINTYRTGKGCPAQVVGVDIYGALYSMETVANKFRRT